MGNCNGNCGGHGGVQSLSVTGDVLILDAGPLVVRLQADADRYRAAMREAAAAAGDIVARYCAELAIMANRAETRNEQVPRGDVRRLATRLGAELRTLVCVPLFGELSRCACESAAASAKPSAKPADGENGCAQTLG